MMIHAPRTAWQAFGELHCLAKEDTVLSSTFYHAAKHEANFRAAIELLWCFITKAQLLTFKWSIPSDAIFVAAHAVEGNSVNAIPITLAAILAEQLDMDYLPQVVQSNRVGHTKANGWKRLANPALFIGPITPDKHYYLIDDFVGMGGTLANLRGYIEKSGGKVIGGMVLTGKEKSLILRPDTEQIITLRKKYDNAWEQWWIRLFGYSFEFLTAAEAGFLARQTKDAEAVRARILGAMRS